MSSDDFEIKLSDAQGPLVLALDVGSTATRGSLYAADGRPIKPRQKQPHAFTSGVDGASTIDPDQVVKEIQTVITDLLDEAGKVTIDGVALDTFASSVIGVDAKGNAITPCYTYADSRCNAEVEFLRAESDESALQQRTGARFHTSYLIPRLRWLATTEPDVVAKVSRWLSLGEYIWLKLIGIPVAGTSVAAWTGMLNRVTGQWDPEALALAGISAHQLSLIADPSQPVRAASGSWASGLKQLRNALFFAPLSDGYSANLGVGALESGDMVMSLATSGAVRVLVADPIGSGAIRVPDGLWSYRVSNGHSLLGGAMNDVGRALTWMRSQHPELTDDEVTRTLLAEPDPASPHVLPFFTGERSTGWRGSARAVFVGVSHSMSASEILRGTMEGVAQQYRRILDELKPLTGEVAHTLVAGRVTQEAPALLPILADTVGMTLTPVTIKRSTPHGTALSALCTLAPDVERAPVITADEVAPNPAQAAHYAERAARFDALYDSIFA